jgi:hypothetical protein
MMDWTNAKPNARFWVLKLIKDNFKPGDKLVDTGLTGVNEADVTAQAFDTPAGKRLLLVNKRGHSAEVSIPAGAVSAMAVDEKSGEGPARSVSMAHGKITLDPYAVTVVNW